MNKCKWQVLESRILLHTGLGLKVWQIDHVSADFPRTRQSAEHKVSHSRFGSSSINKVHTLIVFTKVGFPKISNAENSGAVVHGPFQARWIIQISLNDFCALLLEKSRGFGFRTACHTPYFKSARF